MRRGRKRIIGFLICLALVFQLSPAAGSAAENVYFTAANDKLLELNDATMPVWSGGMLYVSSAVFTEADLGVNYSRSRDMNTAVLYQPSRALVFDLKNNTTVDSSGAPYDSTALVRGGSVFIPIILLIQYFGLEYSYTKIDYGYLVRIKSGSVVLNDTAFIAAAATLLETRYTRYEKDKTTLTPSTPTTPADSDAAAVTEEAGDTTVYLALRVTDEAAASKLLDTLGVYHAQAAFFFSPEQMQSSGDLLRRICAEGYTVGIYLDGTDTAAAQEQAAAANAYLWAHTNAKTRLLYLPNASAAARAALEDAGYCCFTPRLRYGAGALTTARRLSAMAAAVTAKGGRCGIYLGEDAALTTVMSGALVTLRRSGSHFARLTETTA